MKKQTSKLPQHKQLAETGKCNCNAPVAKKCGGMVAKKKK